MESDRQKKDTKFVDKDFEFNKNKNNLFKYLQLQFRHCYKLSL